jgi:hypothetical protein
MAHFAKVENGVVTNVIVIANEALDGKDFPDSESIGQDLIESLGLDGEWIQASYNAKFRGIYPGLGHFWDGTNFKGSLDE